MNSREPTTDRTPCAKCGHPRLEHLHESIDAPWPRFVDGMCAAGGCDCDQYEPGERDIFDDALDLTEQAVADQVDALAGGETLNLFEPMAPPMTPAYDEASTPNERFSEYFRANPHIFAAILELARKDRAAHRRGSGQFYFEVLRRRFSIREEYDEYRLPNEYVAPYMRVLILCDSGFDGVVEIRRRTDEDRDDFERREFDPLLADCAVWFKHWIERRCDARR